MGAFDDLVPASGGGAFDDLIPKAAKRQVGVAEAGGRGVGSTLAGQGNTLALAAAAPAMLVDAVGNLFRAKPSTAAQDFVFSNLVDPAREAQKSYNIDPATEEMGVGATVANIGGNLVGMAPSMVAGGAATAGPKLAAMAPVVQNLVKGAVAAQPSFALPSTFTRAQDLLDAGVDGNTVAKASASNLAANTLMGALPMAKAGGLLTRAATGAGINVASGAAQRGAEAAILGDQYKAQQQDPFGGKEMGTDAGIGALMAAMLGPRAAVRAPVPKADPTLAPGATDFVPPAREPLPADPNAAIKSVTDALFQGDTSAAPDIPLVPRDAPTPVSAPDPTKAPIAPDLTLEGDPAPAPPKRMTVADQVAQDDLAAATRRRVEAEDAFTLAERRQQQADRDLRREGQINQDYQGDDAAYKAGEPVRNITLLDGQMPVMVNGMVDGKADVTWQNEDGTYTRAPVDPGRLTERQAPVNQRLSQDYQGRSSEPQAGVGEGTMQQERMPRRSTDRIAGDTSAGRADPYDPTISEPRAPRGDATVMPREGGPVVPAEPREGRTFDQPPPRPVPPAPDNLLGDNGKRSIEGPRDEPGRLPGPDTPRPGGERFVVDGEGRARADQETYGQDNARSEAARRDQVVRDYSRNDLGNTRRENARNDGSGNDGATGSERRPAPNDAESGRTEAAGGEKPAQPARPDAQGARPDGGAARVEADPRDVPRLQVEHDKVQTEVRKAQTRLNTLLDTQAKGGLDEKRTASIADQIAKTRAKVGELKARLDDIRGQLTDERIPRKEASAGSILSDLRKEGGLSAGMVRDLKVGATDPKIRAGKLKDEDAVVAAAVKHGWLSYEEGQAPGAYDKVRKMIADEEGGTTAKTEGDLEAQARARENEAIDALAKEHGIDTRDMTKKQKLDAIEKAQEKVLEQRGIDEANEAARMADGEDARTIDELLDEVGVTARDIEDAKYAREREAESRAAADEAGREGARGNETAESGAGEAGRENEVRPDAGPAREQTDSGRGSGDGGAGETRPAAGEAGGEPPARTRRDEANYRLNALPFDAVFRGVKKMLGDGKQWKEYADWLHDVTTSLANQLKKPGEAMTALRGKLRTDSGENAAMAVIRWANEDLGRRARIIVDKTGSATARKVLDMMDFELGKGEGTGKVFREAVQQRMGKSLNELAAELQLVNGIAETMRKGGLGRKEAYAKAWEEVIKRVENPSLARQGDIGRAAAKVEAWLKGQRDMQVAAGVDMGDQGARYFPVKYDADKVQADRVSFERDAAAAYMREGAPAEEAKAQAKALADGLIRGESFSLVGVETGAAASATKERVFTKPESLNAMRKWRNLDGRDVLISYANSAAKRAAIAERFGDNFGGKKDKAGKTITPSWKQLVDKITEEGGTDALPILRDLVEIGTGVNQPRGTGAQYADAMRNAMTMSALEKSVLPNLMETVTPLATTNGNVAAGLSMLRTNIHGALAGLGFLPKSERRAAAQSLLEGIGALSDIGSQQQAMARYSGADAGKGGFSEATGKFFEGIGLNKLTDAQRISTADIGAVWFDSLAKAVTGDGGWKSLTKGADAKHLRDMGIPADKVQAFAQYVKGLNGKIPTTAELGKAGEMGALYGDAITRFMNSTVQHGDALTRPSWASTPWGSLVFQFSSYTYAFHKNVVRRAYNNVMDAGNLKNDLGTADRLSLATGMLPGFMLMGGVSYLTMAIRDDIFNEMSGNKKSLTDQAKRERAVQNANLFGKYGRVFEQFGQQRYGTGAAGLFVPPAVAQGAKGVDALAQAAREGSDKNTGERKMAKWAYNTILEPAWQIALSAGPGIPFGAASVAARTFAPSAAEAPFVDAVAGPAKKRAEKPIKGVFE